MTIPRRDGTLPAAPANLEYARGAVRSDMAIEATPASCNAVTAMLNGVAGGRMFDIWVACTIERAATTMLRRDHLTSLLENEFGPARKIRKARALLIHGVMIMRRIALLAALSALALASAAPALQRHHAQLDDFAAQAARAESTPRPTAASKAKRGAEVVAAKVEETSVESTEPPILESALSPAGFENEDKVCCASCRGRDAWRPTMGADGLVHALASL